MNNMDYLKKYLTDNGAECFYNACMKWLHENKPEDASRKDAYIAGAVEFTKLSYYFWESFANDEVKILAKKLEDQNQEYMNSALKQQNRSEEILEKLRICIYFIEDVLEKESPVKKIELEDL